MTGPAPLSVALLAVKLTEPVVTDTVPGTLPAMFAVPPLVTFKGKYPVLKPAAKVNVPPLTFTAPPPVRLVCIDSVPSGSRRAPR